MIKLSVVLEHLSTGELSNINLGSNDSAGVTNYNHKEIANHINLGLIELHTRFLLKQKEVFLRQSAAIQFYELNTAFLESNLTSTEPVKYLLDTPNTKFTGVLKVDSVYNEMGIKLPLNVYSDPTSLFTPSVTSLQILKPVEGATLSVLYRPTPEKVLGSCNNFEDQDVDISYGLLNALILFVTQKVLASRPTLAELQNANTYYQKYEAAVAMALQHGMYTDSGLDSSKFEDRGWV